MFNYRVSNFFRVFCFVLENEEKVESDHENNATQTGKRRRKPKKKISLCIKKFSVPKSFFVTTNFVFLLHKSRAFSVIF